MTNSTTSSESTQEPNNPVQQPEVKSSKLASLNPFHHKKSSKTENEEMSPELRKAIEQMKESKKQKLEEMEREGKKPNDRTSMAYGIGSLGLQGF